MKDDGLDGIVVREFLQLADNDSRIENYAVEIHHADLVAKAAEEDEELLARGNVRYTSVNTASTKRKNAPPPMRTQSQVRERFSSAILGLSLALESVENADFQY